MSQPPYKDNRKLPEGFRGPGWDEPEPEAVSEVLVGYYGPSDQAHPEGGALWQSARRAVEEANRQGGYRRKPFRLVAAWSEDPWRGGAALVARMAVKDRVWVIVGSIDGASTHVAEQVAVKSLVSLINPAATDRSLHLAGVPFMFSVVQGDDLHVAALEQAIARRRVALLSATDHDSRAFVSLLKRTVLVRRHLEFHPDRADLREPARELREHEAVVVVASAPTGARAVQALREAGFRGELFGGPWCGRAVFAQHAGGAAEGVRFSWVGEPAKPFVDYAEACAYDATRLALAAIREAGLNRSRIRDALVRLSPWEGSSGRIEWDDIGQNRRPPLLAVIRGGTPCRI